MKHDIGKCPYPIKSGNLVGIAGFFDGLYTYKKKIKQLNKDNDCKWFALDNVCWIRFLKRARQRTYYGEKYKYSDDSYRYWREYTAG
jgi:hypothetical protein